MNNDYKYEYIGPKKEWTMNMYAFVEKERKHSRYESTDNVVSTLKGPSVTPTGKFNLLLH